MSDDATVQAQRAIAAWGAVTLGRYAEAIDQFTAWWREHPEIMHALTPYEHRSVMMWRHRAARRAFVARQHARIRRRLAQ